MSNRISVVRDEGGVTIEGLHGSLYIPDLTDIQAEDLSRALNRVASGREEGAEVQLS